MDVTKITTEAALQHCPQLPEWTEDMLMQEYNYHMGEKIIRKMFEKNLISMSEMDNMMQIIRRKYQPFLVGIMG